MVENEAQKQAVLTSSSTQAVNVWLGMDTGMHRLGFQPDDIGQHYQALRASSKVAKSIVLATHFACADDLENPATTEQTNSFQRCLSVNSISADENTELSLANSAAILGWPDTPPTVATPRLYDLWQFTFS